MKQTETKRVEVDGKAFRLRPMPAMKAANLSGELFRLLAPLTSMVAKFLRTDIDSISDEQAVAEVANIASNVLDGDEVEKMMRKLLLSGYVIVETNGGNDGEYLTEDMLNEIFCCDVMGLYMMCYHVIKLNFESFFEKLARLSGLAESETVKKILANTETSTVVTLPNSK